MPCFVYFAGLSTRSPISVLDLENNPMSLASLCSQKPRQECACGWVSEQRQLGTASCWSNPGGQPGVAETVQGWPGLPGPLFSHLVLLLSPATCQSHLLI